MTRPHRRRIRLVWEPQTDKPWIIQYDNATRRNWTDVLRFHQHGEATRYLRDVQTRDKLLEAER